MVDEPMRIATLPCLLAALLAAAPAGAQQPGAKPPAKALPAAVAASGVLGCFSLANFRLLMRQAKGDAAAAVAILADPKADHLGCTMLGRDRVTAPSDHVALGGQAYECVGVQGTSICHWVVAGSAVSAEAAKARSSKAPDK